MELNNIRLTSKMLAELYPDVLVGSTATAMPDEGEISFLGDNLKNILILVNERQAKFIPEKQLNFLVTVLTACSLSIADTAIVNTAGKKTDYNNVTSQLRSRVVLLFDVPPVDINLPLDFPFFQVQKFRDQTYVFSPSLEKVEADLAMKKQLWTSLKKAFSI